MMFQGQYGIGWCSPRLRLLYLRAAVDRANVRPFPPASYPSVLPLTVPLCPPVWSCSVPRDRGRLDKGARRRRHRAALQVLPPAGAAPQQCVRGARRMRGWRAGWRLCGLLMPRELGFRVGCPCTM